VRDAKASNAEWKILTVHQPAYYTNATGGSAPMTAYVPNAVEEAGYEPGRQIAFALDVAASELYNKDSGVYDFPGETRLKLSEAISLPVHRTTEEMISYYEELICVRKSVRRSAGYRDV